MTTNDVDPVRAALRFALTRAMRQRDRAATAVYRSALAAIDNAEAVPVTQAAGEVPRRLLTAHDVVRIVRAEAAERRAAADSLPTGQEDEAARLRQEAGLLETFLVAT